MPAAPAIAAELPAQHGGAKALLLTVLGEFVLPGGGAVWTSTLVGAADALGVGEKNARQAIARIADQGLVESERHGRTVRWSLTAAGRTLLETGSERIYGFGREQTDWGGEWLIAHCPVPESHRPLRHRLRTELSFLGFGELSPSLAVSPHVEREGRLRRAIAELGLGDQSVVLRSRTGSHDADVELAGRAWQLEDLERAYADFSSAYTDRCPDGDPLAAFRATVGLVHAWRQFPLVDPELPAQLLPARWAGYAAAGLFRDRHTAWSPAARSWFADLESLGGGRSG